MIKNNWINEAKGIAIILVVLGHAILGFQSAGMFLEYSSLFDYISFTIYSFHMPLFFIISGYTYVKYESIKNNDEYKDLMKKKALNLLIPYFVFCSVQLIIKIVLGGSTNGQISVKDIFLLPIVPQEQFWFLYTLFFIFLVLVFLDMKLKNETILLILLIVVNMTEIYMGNMAFAITSFCVYAVYFYIGMLYARGWMLKRVNLNNKFITLAITLGYIVINIYLYNSRININIHRVLSLILAVVGSFMVISMTNIKSNKYISKIGKYSYEIFLLHTIFGSGIRIILIKVFKIYNIGIHFGAALLLGIGLPIITAKISKKFKVIDFLFKPTRYMDKYINQQKYKNKEGVRLCKKELN